jgi:hypothetical protein
MVTTLVGSRRDEFPWAVSNDCQDVLDKLLLNEAWNRKFPGEAVAYGKALLAAADSAVATSTIPKRQRTLLSRLGFTKKREPIPMAEQLGIVRAAGRWFVFWGERAHPVRAWY